MIVRTFRNSRTLLFKVVDIQSYEIITFKGNPCNFKFIRFQVNIPTLIINVMLLRMLIFWVFYTIEVA